MMPWRSWMLSAGGRRTWSACPWAVRFLLAPLFLRQNTLFTRDHSTARLATLGCQQTLVVGMSLGGETPHIASFVNLLGRFSLLGDKMGR